MNFESILAAIIEADRSCVVGQLEEPYNDLLKPLGTDKFWTLMQKEEGYMTVKVPADAEVEMPNIMLKCYPFAFLLEHLYNQKEDEKEYDIMDIMEIFAKIFHNRFSDKVPSQIDPVTLPECYCIKFSEPHVTPGNLVVSKVRYRGVMGGVHLHVCIDKAGEVAYMALHDKYIFTHGESVLYMSALYKELFINRRGVYHNAYQ